RDPRDACCAPFGLTVRPARRAARWLVRHRHVLRAAARSTDLRTRAGCRTRRGSACRPVRVSASAHFLAPGNRIARPCADPSKRRVPRAASAARAAQDRIREKSMMPTILRGATAAQHESSSRTRRLLSLAAWCLLVASSVGHAFQPPGDAGASMLPHPFVAAELAVQPELEPTTHLSAQAPRHPAVAPFLQRYGGDWEMRWDLRSNRPNLIQGSGIPLIPGSGNVLGSASPGLATGAAIDLATVEARLRDFIEANRDLLGTDGLEFRLDPAASLSHGADRSLWFVEFAQFRDGVRVDGANLFFRISHGNIVQFGSDRVAPVTTDTDPRSGREDAFRLAWQELGFPAATTVEKMVEPGELLLLPVTPNGEDPYLGYRGMAGAGYAHRLAWRFVFRVHGSPETWQMLFDAHAERVIEVRDLNAYDDA